MTKKYGAFCIPKYCDRYLHAEETPLDKFVTSEELCTHCMVCTFLCDAN